MDLRTGGYLEAESRMLFFNCSVHSEITLAVFRLVTSVLSVILKSGFLELIALLPHKELVSKSVFTYKPN